MCPFEVMENGGRILKSSERKGNAAVSWLASPKHPYEDRFRLLPQEIPLVKKANRGEIFAVLDGIGSAPLGMSAAQSVADSLIEFFRLPDTVKADWEALYSILFQTNLDIHSWGFIDGTNRPLGGCAGTIAWYFENRLTLFHAGDTVGIHLRPKERPRILTKLHEVNGAIFRYFGLGKELTIDVVSMAVEDGDLVLLISDGVTKAFGTSEAAEYVMDALTQSGDICRAADQLVLNSRNRGSTDDITVVLFEVEDE